MSPFSPIQKVPPSCWVELPIETQHLTFKYLSEKLTGSLIWVNQNIDSKKQRSAAMLLIEDGRDPPNKNTPLYKRIENACHTTVPNFRGHGFCTTIYEFSFDFNDDKAKEFLGCLDLLNAQSPLGNAVLFSISKLIAGYAIEGNAKVDFLPQFCFLMAMNATNALPAEITQFICLLSVQSMGIEFASSNTEQFYKDFTTQALKKPNIKNSYFPCALF